MPGWLTLRSGNPEPLYAPAGLGVIWSHDEARWPSRLLDGQRKTVSTPRRRRTPDADFVTAWDDAADRLFAGPGVTAISVTTIAVVQLTPRFWFFRTLRGAGSFTLPRSRDRQSIAAQSLAYQQHTLSATHLKRTR